MIKQNEVEEVKFEKERMLKFVKQDMLLNRTFHDLMKRGHSEDGALEAVFYSFVYSDSIMEHEYLKL